MSRMPVVYIATALFCASSMNSASQAPSRPKDGSSFLRDANRPFVYLQFDHVGNGVRRSEAEPATRVWFRFVNNCSVPIVLHISGGVEGMLTGEVSVWDRVVPNPPMLEIISGMPRPAERPSAVKMPNGYESEVGSSMRVVPGDSVLFSVPINHLGPKNGIWHMEVPFWFGVPEGHDLHNSKVGGEPLMSLSYSLYDLPSEVRTIVSKSQ